MKYSREYILRHAFDVFMSKGYDSTSISVLQKELNMSRGAMYCYFKNKEELFFAVIDRYFFDIFDRLTCNVRNNLTLFELIEIVHSRRILVFKLLVKDSITHSVFLNYTALIIQAAKHYPNFVVKFRIIHDKLLSHWRTALVNSIEAGDIRSDVNIEIMSVFFNNLTMKESMDQDCKETDFTVNILKDISRRKEMMNYLYQLICVR